MQDQMMTNEDRLTIRKQVLKGPECQAGNYIWWFGEVGGGRGQGDDRDGLYITPGLNYSSAVRIQGSW